MGDDAFATADCARRFFFRAAANTSAAGYAPLLAERGDPMGEARDLAAGGVLVNDALLSRPHDDRLGFAQRRRRLGAITACDRIFDLADIVAHARAAHLVDRRAARNLARC